MTLKPHQKARCIFTADDAFAHSINYGDICEVLTEPFGAGFITVLEPGGQQGTYPVEWFELVEDEE